MDGFVALMTTHSPGILARSRKQLPCTREQGLRQRNSVDFVPLKRAPRSDSRSERRGEVACVAVVVVALLLDHSRVCLLSISRSTDFEWPLPGYVQSGD